VKRFGHQLVLVAMLIAIGAHWHILQSVAWTTMLAENLRTTSLSEAVARTFDGKHPCYLCKQIAKSKQDQKKSEFPSPLKKLEFFPVTTTFVFAAPTFGWDTTTDQNSLRSVRFPPPKPPPESAFV
jgi:hypothetical protein